ncbi:MAG: ABC transporter ATP-binding protein, partial [Propionibacteriaceae bacterium]
MTTQTAPATTAPEADDPKATEDVGRTEQRVEDWRGIAAEHSDLDQAGGTFVKKRSRRLLLELLKPYRRWMAVLVIVVLGENAARLSVPKLVQHGIDAGVPQIIAGQGMQALLQTIIVMVAAVALQAVSRVIFLRGSGMVGQRVLLELRRRLFLHFQKLDVKFHDNYTSGRVVSRLTNDIDAIAELLLNGFDGLVTAALTLVGVGVLLLTMDLKLGAICLICFPVLFLLVRWFSLSSTRIYRKVREMAALVIVHFVETMTGIKAVQSYRREPRNQEIFTDLSQRYADTNVGSFRLVAIFMPGVRLIGNLTIGAVLLIGGWFVMGGEMTVGVLAAFLLYLRMFFEPMQEISQFYNTFQSATSALEKLSGVLEEQPSVVQPTHPTPLPAAHGDLHLEHVHFAYAKDRPVLPDLELHIPAGQTVALVGTTGAGKTTIAKLMA